jgi:hypothetical protein
MAGPAIRAWQIATALAQDHDVRLVTTSECSLTSPDVDVRHLAGMADARELEAWCDVLFFQGNACRTCRSCRRPRRSSSSTCTTRSTSSSSSAAGRHGPGPAPAHARARRREANQQCLRGDFLVCASEKQRDFWLGHLAALGRLNTVSYDDDVTLRSLIDVAPFGISPVPPQRSRPALKGVVPASAPTTRSSCGAAASTTGSTR